MHVHFAPEGQEDCPSQGMRLSALQLLLSRGTPTANRHAEEPHPAKQGAQMDFFSAAVQNAFTTVFAGFAFTTTVLPNISLLPALVATVASVSKILETSDFFRSCAVAMASARPVLVITGLEDFMALAFIDFIGAILKMKICWLASLTKQDKCE